MTQVVLVNSNRMRPPVAPLALDYLADALHGSGFEVDILDLCFAPDVAAAVKSYFAAHSPVAVGVTFRNTDDTYMASQESFLPLLKSIIDTIKAETGSPIILGGAGFSVAPEEILGYCGLDLGLWGEGEYALPLLLSKLSSGEEWRDVPGLVYRAGDAFRRNPPCFMELDRRPAPARSAVDNRRYFREGGQGNIETKRGCPRACIYCADPVGKGTTLRLRSPRSIAGEIEALLSQGIAHLHFCDSEFNLPPGHALEICREIIARGLGGRLRWYAYASPAPFTGEMAQLFLRAGCAGIDFGADSGHDPMLRALGRDFNAEDLASTAALCHRHGLVFMYDLLLGGPGETKESLRETIELMKRLSPPRVGAALGVRLVPHTRLAGWVKAQGCLESNPNLHGSLKHNQDLLEPVFYVSAALGPDPAAYLSQLVGNDERFFVGSREAVEQNYNYNENTVLMDAIRRGYRGAYWDILRRLAEGSE